MDNYPTIRLLICHNFDDYNRYAPQFTCKQILFMEIQHLFKIAGEIFVVLSFDKVAQQSNLSQVESTLIGIQNS